jgi:hypothetical protein
LKKKRFSPSKNKPPGKTDTVSPPSDKNGYKFLFCKKNRFTPSKNKPPRKTDTVPPHPDKNGYKFLF